MGVDAARGIDPRELDELGQRAAGRDGAVDARDGEGARRGDEPQRRRYLQVPL